MEEEGGEVKLTNANRQVAVSGTVELCDIVHCGSYEYFFVCWLVSLLVLGVHQRLINRFLNTTHTPS